MGCTNSPFKTVIESHLSRTEDVQLCDSGNDHDYGYHRDSVTNQDKLASQATNVKNKLERNGHLPTVLTGSTRQNHQGRP